MIRKVYIVLLSVLAVSCSRLENIQTRDIMVSASVDNIAVITKADNSNDNINDPESVFRGSVPSEEYPLEVDLWFSEESGTYKHNPNGLTSLPCKTTIKYVSSSPDYPNPIGVNKIKYSNEQQNDGSFKNAYCVGFYPQGKWSVSETTATANIDGKTDLMFAPQIVGNWTRLFGAQTYSHLTTWIKVCVCATSPDAIKHWGDITGISLIDHEVYPLYDEIILPNLSAKTIEYTKEEGKEISLAISNSALPIETTIKEYGSVLCSPSAKYNLNITTSNGKEKTILIDLKDLEGKTVSDNSYARGKMFVITLYFNPFNVVEGVCTLNSWNNENENLELQ